MGMCARLGYQLFAIATPPPEDPKAFEHWQLRRSWLIVSELMALPFLGSLGVFITEYFKLSAITALFIGGLLGALGFGLVLLAIEHKFKKELLND